MIIHDLKILFSRFLKFYFLIFFQLSCVNHLTTESTRKINMIESFFSEFQKKYNVLMIHSPIYLTTKSVFGSSKLSLWSKGSENWCIIVETLDYTYYNAFYLNTFIYSNEDFEFYQSIPLLNKISNNELFKNEFQTFNAKDLKRIANRKNKNLFFTQEINDYVTYFSGNSNIYNDKMDLENLFLFLISNNRKEDLFRDKSEIYSLIGNKYNLKDSTYDWYLEENGQKWFSEHPSEISFINQSYEILKGTQKKYHFDMINSNWLDIKKFQD